MLSSVPQLKHGPICDAIQFNAEPCEATITKIPTRTKVIGLTWEPKGEDFSFETYKRLAESADVKYTIGGIFPLVPRIYDVNGYIVPHLLRGKLILEDGWTYRNDVTVKRKPLVGVRSYLLV